MKRKTPVSQFATSARDALKDMAYGPTSGVGIRFSELGDDAGLLGAAAVAEEHLQA